MTALRFSSLGIYPLQIPIEKLVDGVPQDLSAEDELKVAVTPIDRPLSEDDFKNAHIGQYNDGTWFAEVNVGPGTDLELTVGRYLTFAKFDEGAIVEGGLVEVY